LHRKPVRGFPVVGCPWILSQLAARGPEPMGIIAWKQELLVVPFSAQWVGELFLRPDPSFWVDQSVGAGHLSIVNTHEFGLTRPSAAGSVPAWCRAAACSGCFRRRGCLASPMIMPAERPGSHAPFPASYPVVPPGEPWPFPMSYRVWRETTRRWAPGLEGTIRDPRKRRENSAGRERPTGPCRR
jgi:hypothetical protein